MKKTLYVGSAGKTNFDNNIGICASDKKIFDNDLELTVNEEDAKLIKESDAFECNIYMIEDISLSLIHI